MSSTAYPLPEQTHNDSLITTASHGPTEGYPTVQLAGPSYSYPLSSINWNYTPLSGVDDGRHKLAPFGLTCYGKTRSERLRELTSAVQTIDDHTKGPIVLSKLSRKDQQTVQENLFYLYDHARDPCEITIREQLCTARDSRYYYLRQDLDNINMNHGRIRDISADFFYSNILQGIQSILPRPSNEEGSKVDSCKNTSKSRWTKVFRPSKNSSSGAMHQNDTIGREFDHAQLCGSIEGQYNDSAIYLEMTTCSIFDFDQGKSKAGLVLYDDQEVEMLTRDGQRIRIVEADKI